MKTKADYWESTEDLMSTPYTGSMDLRVRRLHKGDTRYIEIRKWYTPRDSADGKKAPGKGIVLDELKLEELHNTLGQIIRNEL